MRSMRSINSFITERLKLNKDSKINTYKQPKDAKVLDILYENSSGRQIVDSEVLDPKLGFIPIGLCVSYEDKTTFVTNEGVYCYRIRPFGLKNVGVTYQGMMNTIFTE